MSTTTGTGTAAQAADGPEPEDGAETGPLLGIGAAAARAGVSERALRYYQQIGLITPCACTPAGTRRYSEDDLARVARIRQLQVLLGFNLDEIAVVLRSEDRMAQIKRSYHHEHTSDAERRELVRESLRLQLELRKTVQAKRVAIEGFLADLDARIARASDLLGQMTAPAGLAAHRYRRTVAGDSTQSATNRRKPPAVWPSHTR